MPSWGRPIQSHRDRRQAVHRRHQWIRLRRRRRAGARLAIRVAAENARLAQPEIKLGIITGFGGSQRLVRIVGKARAAGLCLFGEPIDAKTALDWGLVNKVVPQSSLAAEAATLAEKLATYSPLALKYTLEAINTASDVPLAEGQAYEETLFGLCFGTEDMKEGTAAFLEKRKAHFKGR